MARGDPVFCRLDIDKILNGEKISPLPGNHFKVYIVLWALAVKCHSYVLELAISQPQYILDSAHLGANSEQSRRKLGAKSATRILRDLHNLGLIEILPSSRIRVIGVKEVHSRLLWDKCPENIPIEVPI